MSRPTLVRAIRGLINRRMIARDSKLGDTSTYYLTDKSQWVGKPEIHPTSKAQSQGVDHTFTGGGKREIHGVVNERSTKNTREEYKKNTREERGEQPRQALVVTQAASIATPPPPTGGADAASIALEYFPAMGIWQQELIANASINHLTIWRKCCEDWRDNRYSPRNINGMIDSYFKAETRHSKEQTNGTNGSTNRQTAGERKAGEYLALQRKLGENASNDPDYKPLPGFEWLESIR